MVKSSKKADQIDFQLLGGRFERAADFIRDYPIVKVRWMPEILEAMYELLCEADAYGLGNRRGRRAATDYLELRGDVPEFVHVTKYNTSEYCVVLWLRRNRRIAGCSRPLGCSAFLSLKSKGLAATMEACRECLSD